MMNKEDIKNAIDLIDPDLYMETRLKAKSIPKKPHSRAFGKAMAGAVALCVAFALMFGFNLPLQTDNPVTQGQTESSQQSIKQISPFIMVAGAAERELAAEEHKTLKLNETFPFAYKLSVIDVRGMSESEKQAKLMQMSREFEDTVINSSSAEYEMAQGCIRGGFENIIFTEVIYNKFVLDLKDKESIKSINVKNSSKWGYVEYLSSMPFEESEEMAIPHGTDITVSGDEYDSDRDGFLWRNSHNLDNAINDNPDIPLSTFKDTITFTVEYTDGTKEIGVIDVTFDDEGNGAFTLKEYKEG
ncbi:MAG: hypothetical protein E7543_07920 [Ruminococcaceae bacterium]|nr:hypothetical protein [Oscillospiraceae bacterium]